MAGHDAKSLLLEERAEVAAFLRSLDHEQWNVPSLCPSWTVMDVAAHLASFASLTISGFGLRLLRAGFVPPKANARGVAEWTKRGATAIVDRLARTDFVGLQRLAPRVGLTDELIHHQDMRRPLGMGRDIAPERLRIALDVIANRPTGTGGNRRCRDLTLLPNDLDWSKGRGPEVTGPAEAILMVLAGQPAALNDLSGDGKAILARR